MPVMGDEIQKFLDVPGFCTTPDSGSGTGCVPTHLRALGVGDDRIYVDHGLTGTNRDGPGQRLALAACRAGDIGRSTIYPHERNRRQGPKKGGGQRSSLKQSQQTSGGVTHDDVK
jgi:hypothetical protein